MAQQRVIVGSFTMRPGTSRGIHVFACDPKNGGLKERGCFMTDLIAGQTCYSSRTGTLYATNEYKDRRGEIGGGGKIVSARFKEGTDELIFINERDTFGPMPSYICLTASGKFLLVPHHTSGSVVTRVKKGPDGKYRAETFSDDASIVVFPVNEDGSIGEMCSAYVIPCEREDGRIRRVSHLHNCVQSPDGKLFLVCNKGLDRIHGFHLNEASGELTEVSTTYVGEGTHPRYGVFHPSAGVFYQNCENSAFIHVWKYESESGALTRIQVIALLEDETASAAWTKEGAADLAITRDGKYLYASVRGLHVLTVYRIGDDGRLAFLQNIASGGENPRGLRLSPDERFLYCMNRDSADVTVFNRMEGGLLEQIPGRIACPFAANMQFIV